MLPLFGSYLLVQYTFWNFNFHYVDAAKVIGLIIFVQTMTFLSMILTTIWNLFTVEDLNDNQITEESKSLELTEMVNLNVTREIAETTGDIKENLFQDCKGIS